MREVMRALKKRMKKQKRGKAKILEQFILTADIY